MSKKILKLLILSLFVLASCSKDESFEEITINPAQKEPLTAQQINAQIDEAITTTGTFNWKNASSQLLWSAAYRGNFIITIGFGTSSSDFDRSKSNTNLKMQTDLLNTIAFYEGKSKDQVLLASDQYLNLIDVYVEKQETIIALRKSGYIRYIEPGDYKYFANSGTEKSSVTSSGCGFESENLSTADYTTVAPNAKVPWTFYQHNIPSAWNVSTGSGITIGIVDTGVSPNQSLLGANFNDGLSSGRTIQKYGVYVDSIWPWSTGTDGPNDQCGHGTSMSSVAAAPRNSRGGPVGVAYNSNLIVYRAASNVVLDGYHEQNGVKNAFTALGNNANVKIISMSMGYIFSVGKIEDGVKYAYGKGKLIFCAGGTSTSFTTFVGVIFPAWMPETVAVTGVIEGTSTQKCDVCHTGSKIDFTVQMQRSASGNTVPVESYYEGLNDYVGGSSVATATTAGIAALVWAKNPTWTRDQVLTKMKQSASLYPNKNPEYGYGNVNAYLAVQ
ncbi:S8 family serine peptidase [Flavobacterium sp. SUN052]|uniref:S8 family peptidase n=1 Tax=Flavobacterium sp. SUN052 TaxID=3002441 RepID=UPI00237E979C|nr:S8 family serine peptidase [Flavobacterium sp. SUN052]MEC4003772.1 S8 family serine peptidase [Flavobacterium sp. SUN052]